MERLFTFWEKFIPVPQETRNFIEVHAKVINATKNEYYIDNIEIQHHWCFILEGIVAEYRTNQSGKQIIIGLSVGNSYFTGTKHPFTNRREKLKIKFLKDCSFVQIPNHIIQFAQKEYIAASEFLHALKQKKLDEYLKMLVISKQDTKVDQYLVFRELYSNLIKSLTIEQICAILNMDRTTYYKALEVYNLKN